MNRRSAYHPLRWVVEVKHDWHPCWEPMAAFNVDSVAKRYADDCHKTNPTNSYRVMERMARGFRGPIHERFTVTRRAGPQFGTDEKTGQPTIIIA